MARLPHGGDLLEEIAAVADAHGMQAAELRAIGALQTARLAFYDQATHEYGEFAVDAPVELVGLLGNVSRRDGATAVHAHATLAGHDGACVGGHVAPGCVIFACELDPAGAGRRAAGARVRRGHRPAALARPLSGPRVYAERREDEEREWCRKGDLNPHEVIPSLGPQPSASTNSAIPTLRDCDYRRSRAGRSTRARPASLMTMGGPSSCSPPIGGAPFICLQKPEAVVCRDRGAD